MTLTVIRGGLNPDSPVTKLAGVTEGYRRKFEKVGVETIGDLLRYYPRRHEDFTETVPVCFLAEEAKQTVRARLENIRLRMSRGGRSRAIVEAFFSDDTGRMKAMWFNQAYLVNKLVAGQEYVMSGKVRRARGAGLVMMNPAFEEEGGAGLHTGRLVPIYPETEGLTSRFIRPRVADALPLADQLEDDIPDDAAGRLGLPPFPDAVRALHFPESEEELAAARRRVAFRQLLLMQLGVVLSRDERARHDAPVIAYDVDVARRVRDSLPFRLTDAQRKAAHQVFTDLAEPHPMARLLQGDVGSGKTAVAAMAAAMVAASGRQTLFMAPTEILAQQHVRTLQPYLEPMRLRLGGLFGSTTASARRALLAGLAAGELDLLVGTHALLEPDVVPRALGLVVTDEQHRFGIDQRMTLAAKGGSLYPHLLSMTATPIPRTLQLTLFGDLTVSVLDELPPGRQPVTTRLVLPEEREEAYAFVAAQVRQGRQVFVICPLVEESEVLQVRSATGEFERLSTEVFPDLRLALLHGRMKAAEKDAVMERFKAGAIDILVSTAVVEVGVDVPNASVMLIEGAERFGLAQLHQFRGRVGRGSHPSSCLLLSDSVAPESNQRLNAMVRYTSGFDLAEVDLELRGPGDIVGATGAQHGRDAESGLLVAGLLDTRLIAAAREEAERLVRGGLDRHPRLLAAVGSFKIAGSLS